MRADGASPMTERSEDDDRPSWRGPQTRARAYGLGVLALICFLSGLFVPQPMIFVSVPVTLLLAFSVLRSRDPRPQLSVRRTTERVQITEGESTRVRLRVTNMGGRDAPMVLVRDAVHPMLKSKKTRSGFSSSFRAGETKDFYYEVTASSFGVHALGPITLRAQDPSGLFDTVAVMESYSKLVVLPGNRERIAHLGIRPRKTRPWPGEIVARRAGAGMDYYSLRRFMTGDPLKHVNWRASARHPQVPEELLVNEHQAEVGAEVLIVVDAGRARMGGPGRDDSTVYSVKAAISLAERLLHDRNRVGLLTTGANARRIPAGYGRRQFERMAMSLLQLEPGSSDFRWWVECSIHMFFPNISQVIFVSPLGDPESRDAAAELARGGEKDVIVVSPNTLGLAAASGKFSREKRIALRLAEMERAVDLGILRSANILVVDWTSSESLEEVMEVHEKALAKYAAFTARRG